MNSADVIVIGGGLVGTSVAYGLAGEDRTVILLDGGDDVLRASRGNFGLIWVQGKGFGFAPYARWTLRSAEQWPLLAQRLLKDSGIDVQLMQQGGFSFCYSKDLYIQRRQRLEEISNALGGNYPFEMLDQDALKARLPNVGPNIFGASFTPMDGHVNSLKLLLALHAACNTLGVSIRSNQAIERIEFDQGIFTVHGSGVKFRAPRIVLAAGLGNRLLAAQVGLHAPVIPNRGQLMVSERTTPFLFYPTLHVRQTDEGTVQIGDSLEEAGYDDFTTTDVLRSIARRAIDCFPALAGINLVRAWGALRVMTPDGFPIYQESRTCPGAFVTTCHSGVTLAPAHVFNIAPWVAGSAAPQGIEEFAGDRFLNQSGAVDHA